MRIAAVGDIHFAEDTRGTLRPHWSALHECADVFLLCGDLTNLGTPAQARALAEELDAVRVPVVAVLGNHDYHAGSPEAVRAALQDVGVTVLEGEHTTLELDGRTLGIAGCKGFGGGFAGACGHAFGEPEMKEFMYVTERAAGALDNAGADLAIHGHEHSGAQKGITPRGIPVRNVAMPLIRRPFAIFTLDSARPAQFRESAPAAAGAPGA